MNLKNLILLSLSTASLLGLVISCGKEEPTKEDEGGREEEIILNLSPDNISIDVAGGQKSVQLTANTDWQIENPTFQDGWCTIRPVSGAAGTEILTIYVVANDGDERMYAFNILAGDKKIPLTVIQSQNRTFEFEVKEENGSIFYQSGGICSVVATTSLEYDIEYTDNGGEWISLIGTKAPMSETLQFRIAEYPDTGGMQRECDIIFKERGGDLVQYNDRIVEFEDPDFKRYCLSRFDTNNDGEISKRETVNIQDIHYEKRAESLRGIEEFDNLLELVCIQNGLEYLDLSKNLKLRYLCCIDNQLTSLDVSNNIALDTLKCDSNQLTSLDIRNNPNLTYLSCESNYDLASLDVSGNPNLKSLYCNYIKLTFLDVSNNPNLGRLDCSSNDLTSLDLSGCPNLSKLNCGYNDLTSLDVSGCPNLSELNCEYNDLTFLDVSGCPNLSELNCGYNDLTSLDLSGCPNLSKLNCENNGLTSLDVSNNPNLRRLRGNRNNLTSLDLSGCPNLRDLNCEYNDLTSLDVSGCPNLYLLNCRNNPLRSITISESQQNASYQWLDDIRRQYPDIEIRVK